MQSFVHFYKSEQALEKWNYAADAYYAHRNYNLTSFLSSIRLLSFAQKFNNFILLWFPKPSVQ